MSHVLRKTNQAAKKKAPSPKEQKEIMNEERWQYVRRGISDETLNTYFEFLDSGVVIRSGPYGIPLMTTTGIYGPIEPQDTVQLQQNEHHVVNVIPASPPKKSLLHELKELKLNANPPKKGNSLLVNAKWISGLEGGGLQGLDSSSNVFGGTGSLLVNAEEVNFPVLDMYHKDFHETLAYYGAKLLTPNESFYMGYDKPIFGFEYDTSLPGYIQDYVMQPFGGGGLFVEYHPFPHIWFPNPDENERATNICRILLGRIVPDSSEENKKINKFENKCLEIKGNPIMPEYHFTVFRIPIDGHAVAVDECSIHNDSFCNGKQVVFIADTDANTVALRETGPFKNIRISETETPHK